MSDRLVISFPLVRFLMMTQRELKCPQCARAIAPEDTITVRQGRPSHQDCKKPRTLTPEERALLLLYCRTHAVAQCLACLHHARLGELSSNPLGGGPYLCPECFRDLTEIVRKHLYGCAMLPAEVRRRSHALLEAAQNLVKQSQQLRDRTDVLMREAEAALDERRNALRQSLKDSGGT